MQVCVVLGFNSQQQVRFLSLTVTHKKAKLIISSFFTLNARFAAQVKPHVTLNSVSAKRVTVLVGCIFGPYSYLYQPGNISLLFFVNVASCR
jgi:hypothetical protein